MKNIMNTTSNNFLYLPDAESAIDVGKISSIIWKHGTIYSGESQLFVGKITFRDLNILWNKIFPELLNERPLTFTEILVKWMDEEAPKHYSKEAIAFIVEKYEQRGDFSRTHPASCYGPYKPAMTPEKVLLFWKEFTIPDGQSFLNTPDAEKFNIQEQFEKTMLFGICD